jgi:ribosomal protein L11 methylase PrmA
MKKIFFALTAALVLFSACDNKTPEAPKMSFVLTADNIEVADLTGDYLPVVDAAAKTVAIDNDEWAYRNALDNIRLNDENEIIVELGDASSLNNRQFDVILANINRNILLRDMKEYVKCLVDGGKIFFSGFYEEDLVLIKKEAERLGLTYSNHVTKNNWTAAVFVK